MRFAIRSFSLLAFSLISWLSAAPIRAADAGDSAKTAAGAAAFGPVEASGLRWLHLSSQHGDLPVPGYSTQQTGCVVADLAKDGVNGFVALVPPTCAGIALVSPHQEGLGPLS